VTITRYEQPAPLPPSQIGDELERGPAGWVARLRAAAEIAGHIGNTDFVPQGLRGNPAAIAAAILYGDEVGLSPMQSLAKIAVIKGRPSLTAEAQRSLILAAGHELWFEESTTTRAIAAGRRKGSDRIGRITFTLDDAKRAGLAGQQNWRTYPAEMLRARASAALARAMFADIIGGLAATEEIDDPGWEAVATDVVELEQPKTRRRRRTTIAAAAEPVPPTPEPDEQPQPDPIALASDTQRRRIFALMRDVGIPEQRETRLTYISDVIGHSLETTSDLTASEASTLIEELERLEEMSVEERFQLLDEVFKTPKHPEPAAEFEQIPFGDDPIGPDIPDELRP
jgi:hypothetical protein